MILGFLSTAYRRAAALLRSVGLGRLAKAELIVTPYCGWGTPQLVELEGRVLVPRRSHLPLPHGRLRRDRLIANLLTSLGRLWSLEVPGVAVRGSLHGVYSTATSDAEGFFTLRFALPEGLPAGWHHIHIGLPGRASRCQAQALVVDQAPFGVISDLDDTVVQTGVSKRLRMLFTVLSGSARTRLPFPGVGRLYRGFARRGAPIFYVSSSPWNFFEVLWHFLEYRHIPQGPLFLRDWGWELLRGHRDHKLKVIERVLHRYPHLHFVLVGDSGERDPEIYAELARRFPKRVLAVYIRDVAEGHRQAQVARLRDELSGLGVPMLLAKDSLAAAHHAMAMNLIDAADLLQVVEVTSP